ncbi:exopolysaccharide biosynthesis polyprenyl glycosylphosphotransferase [Methylobacterium sp. 174MFSha1.1]|nr:exopolysaccharide biosynthesis polyprenyl glycosylphosphotransferase [Methylobacterium sp. 174MFSha1.1]
MPAGGLALLLAPGLLAPGALTAGALTSQVSASGTLASGTLALSPAGEAGSAAAIARVRPAPAFRPGMGPVAKRALDVVGAALGLVLLLPLLLVVALLIKCDSRGPVLFRQSRIGLGNRPFRVWKFRTMTCCENGSVVRQARRDDPRVTRIGRVLRRTSLDELPQLVNVLLGSMSLVGPRPHAVAHDAQFTGTVARYAERHAVRPGITGWAQVRGCRGETPNAAAMQRRVDLDLAYIEHWSLLLDLLILGMTLREIFRSQAAY